MKQTFLLSILLLVASLAKSQTGYIFAYGVNTNDKSMYVSEVMNVSKYTGCQDDTYHTKLTPKNCMMKSFTDAVKIDAGSKYYRFELTVMCKRNQDSYSSEEYFATKDEADRKRKEIMAGYAEMNYAIKKLDL